MKLILVVLACLFFVSCFASLPNDPFDDHEEITKLLMASILGANPKANGIGGGINCAGCTGLVAVLEQYAYVHDQPFLDAMKDLCSILPGGLEDICDTLVDIYGPKIVNGLELKFTPDQVCMDLGICTEPQCRLFPPPTGSVSDEDLDKHDKIKVGQFPEHWKPGEWIYDFAQYHKPLIDLDGDLYSTIKTFRGADWRGRDCDDFKSDIYPGRNSSSHPAEVDHNCNGIYGTDPETGIAYEDLYCSQTPYLGTAILGDSAAAHFHVPPEMITPAKINSATYDDLLGMLANEFDWPMLSATTGFTQSEWIGRPKGPVESIYKKMLERNLCTHRDFQNIGVNGARTSSMASNIMYSFARNQKTDSPVLLTYALIGNDVCNGHPGLGHMTTPEEFYDNVVKAMDYLDTVLPMGSHVVFMGLADGRILYDSMHDRIHPIGELRQDVTYEDLYNYLNCLQISPCWGWLNSDGYWRNQTSYRALNLSLTYQLVIKNNQYENFDMTYTNCPVRPIFNEWVAKGGEAWELIEPVDGFHPNQIANSLIADYQWNLFNNKYPYLIPPVNPNNDEISKLFGDQGGY